jgi:O-antigen ligase
VLLFGLIGLPGNSAVTGIFLSASMAAVFLCTFRAPKFIGPSDVLYAGFAAAVVCSVLANGSTAEPKEYALLLLTLAAYPACRLVNSEDIAGARRSFILTQLVLVVIGTAVSAWALIGQWNDSHGKPVIFGFDGAAIYFLQSLGFVLIAIVSASKLSVVRSLVVSALIVLPMAVYAASLVRFTFIALILSLIAAAWFSERVRRASCLIIIGAVVAGIAIGLTARSTNAVAQFAIYARGKAQTDEHRIATGPPEKHSDSLAIPSCTVRVNADNSIAIRTALLQDAFAMLPAVGLVGFGIDGFMQWSCVKFTEIHNAPLQAFVEFGWPGGLLLLGLIGWSLLSLMRTARRDGASRFLLCSLLFVFLLSLAHGRLSREAALFAFMGGAAGLSRSTRTISLSQATAGARVR